MDIFFIFLKGLMIGLAIAAPVGPIAILTIKTTLAHGRLAGFATGAGAAFADTIYAIIGAFGVVLVSGFLNEYSAVIRIVGGIVLMIIGARIVMSKKEKQEQAKTKALGSKLVKDFVTTFFLTLTNPATIIAFLAIFAALGISATSNFAEAAIVVAGVFAGSLLWWFILSAATSLMRARVTPEILHRINMISGAGIVLFGLAAMISAF